MDVWLLQLHVADELLARCEGALQAHEQAQQRRFLTEPLRRQYASCRGQLRHILATYLGCQPIDVQLRNEPWGKPVLATEHASNLSFNLSHSDDAAVCAVSIESVGVDLERVRKVSEANELAAPYLPDAEAASVARAPARERDRLFLRYWTRYEARAKASGRGITGPLADIASNYWVQDLSLPNGFVGALATPAATTIRYICCCG